MIQRCLILLALTASTAYPQAKVGTSVTGFLELSPSVRSNGMGTVGVMLTDHESAYYNPAALGFLDNKYASVSFYPRKARLVEFMDSSSIEYNSTVLTARLPDRVWSNSLPVGIGIAYQHLSYVDGPYIERTYDGIPTERTFFWKDYADCFSVGIGYSGVVDVGVGVTYKDLSEEVVDYKGSGDAFDFGLLFRAPLNGLFLSQPHGDGYRLRSSLLLGMSVSNYGSSFKFMGGDYVLPKTGRFGCGMELVYGSERMRWLSLLPAYEMEVLFPGDDQRTGKFGMEAGLADALFLRVGTVNAQEGLVGFDTYGIGVSSRGIKQMLLGDRLDVPASNLNLSKFLLAHLNVEFSYARIDREGNTMIDKIDYYSINVIL